MTLRHIIFTSHRTQKLGSLTKLRPALIPIKTQTERGGVNWSTYKNFINLIFSNFNAIAHHKIDTSELLDTRTTIVFRIEQNAAYCESQSCEGERIMKHTTRDTKIFKVVRQCLHPPLTLVRPHTHTMRSLSTHTHTRSQDQPHTHTHTQWESTMHNNDHKHHALHREHTVTHYS